jgi:hypothetical protein
VLEMQDRVGFQDGMRGSRRGARHRYGEAHRTPVLEKFRNGSISLKKHSVSVTIFATTIGT